MEQESQLLECPALVGKPEFETCFFNEVTWCCNLDVSDFCQNGGWAKDEPTFHSLQITKTENDTVTGRFKVRFTEATGDSCSHVAGEKRRTGDMEFTLCRRTGKATFKPYSWECRDYEPEEF